MSDRPRVRRIDAERIAPIRDWSNLFRSPGAQAMTAAPGNGAAMKAQVSEFAPDGDANGSAPAATLATPDAVSAEALRGIESAYRVIDEHLQEGRRAAQARPVDARPSAPGAADSVSTGAAGAGVAAPNLEEIVEQGLRLYSSLAPLWSSIVNSLAGAAVLREPSPDGLSAPPPAPIPRNTAAPVIVEIASARMARVTVDLAQRAGTPNLVVGGLLAIEAEKPPLKAIALTIEPGSNRTVVTIRVPEDQPPGVYSGVIVDRESGEAHGTITLRIDA
jgi:hypothetical protein